MRDILFEIFSKTEISKRFDKSNEFWRRFNVFSPEEQKCLLCYVTLAVNPKKYFEYFKSGSVNKKHKGVKKGSLGMEYENFAERIKPLNNFKTYKKLKADSKDVVRISVKKGEMTTQKVKKKKKISAEQQTFLISKCCGFCSIWTLFFE